MFYGKFNGSGDRDFMRQTMQRFRRIFAKVDAGDNMILFDRALGYQREPRFVNAFGKNCHTDQERSLSHRLNILTWAAEQALNVEGDFVECGVWRGFCSAVITDYLDFASVEKNFYLYDTYAGIPAAYDGEGLNNKQFEEIGIYEDVVERFAPYENVKIVKGTVPDSFAEVCPEEIAFLHIDMNSAKSEIAALDGLFDRINPGGFIIFDDYGWGRYRAQKNAEDKWMATHGHTILELPTGQGFLIKK